MIGKILKTITGSINRLYNQKTQRTVMVRTMKLVLGTEVSLLAQVNSIGGEEGGRGGRT